MKGWTSSRAGEKRDGKWRKTELHRDREYLQKYFGLIDKDKRVYILNDLGIAFLEGEAKVPRAVYTRFNEVVDQEDPIYIYQVENYAQAKEEWEEQASLYN